MVRYIIYTENKNLAGIKDILNSLFAGYSIQEQIGVWNKIEEKSLRIELLGSYRDEDAKQACWAIKQLNNQETVALTVERLENCWFI